MLKTKIIFFVLFTAVLLSSCATRKDLVYLQFDEIDNSKVTNDYQLTFKPDDLLQIIISSEDIISAQPFNLPLVANPMTNLNVQAIPMLQTYLVNSEGEVEIPVLGKLKLGGLKREQAIELIKNKLTPKYLKNPIVNILITNFKITVLGDVKFPKVFTLNSERVSIMDALGMAGDLNISGIRKKVIVVREENGKKNKYSIDLRSNKLFSSPAYYLQQNDIVYVEQNKAKIKDASYTRTMGLVISLASIFISLLAVIK
jgi:polysaccharide export outer membrane protein